MTVSYLIQFFFIIKIHPSFCALDKINIMRGRFLICLNPIFLRYNKQYYEEDCENRSDIVSAPDGSDSC